AARRAAAARSGAAAVRGRRPGGAAADRVRADHDRGADHPLPRDLTAVGQLLAAGCHPNACSILIHCGWWTAAPRLGCLMAAPEWVRPPHRRVPGGGMCTA